MKEPQPFDYQAFINELRVLYEAFKDPPLNQRNASSSEFKRWKHELGTLIDQVHGLGYEVHCSVAYRNFQISAPYNPVSRRDQQARFDSDLDATNLEIETILKRYDSYGEPKKKGSAESSVVDAPSTPLNPPEKITWNWLKAHMPIGPAITTVSAVVATSFGCGIYVGQSNLYRSMMTTAPTIGSATASPSKSIELPEASAAKIDASKPSAVSQPKSHSN